MAEDTMSERRPTHLCLDCGAVGYAGGYHDHGDGQAGDTASIAAVLAQLREGGDVLDDAARYRSALQRIASAESGVWGRIAHEALTEGS